MKRYLSVDQIYVEKLAELCGESYAANNSHNLIKCQEINCGGWSWKVIYFALIDYFGRTPELETEIVGRTIVFEEMF